MDMLNKGNIVFLGNNMPWRIRKPFIDWRGHVKQADYNGYGKVSDIRGDIVTILPLYGRDITGNAWIAHPVDYRIIGDALICIENIEDENGHVE
jgi:hypothetical protein